MRGAICLKIGPLALEIVIALLALHLCVAGPPAFAQSAGTGAIAGTVTDPSGSVVPDAQITVTNEATGIKLTVRSQGSGGYTAPLLLPGAYKVEAFKTGFVVWVATGVTVNVTETAGLNIRLTVGSTAQTVTVQAEPNVLQTESGSLGRVTSGGMVQALPLVTRNYTQIIALNPAVSSEVTNAGAVGRGGSQLSLSVAGSSDLDNNFQMNGANVNDVQEQNNGVTFSGGVPIPNPDTIQEFKVQTAAYDAAYGRSGGANVNVVTKGGTNDFHGTLFEYLRNTALDANDFFRNQLGQPKGQLKQNQFGFTFGGPIKKNKLTFFTSYQGTRQINGVANSCSTNFREPALTDSNRTAAGLGALLGGQVGFNGSGGGKNVVAADGSDISPQAIAFLNLKLPSGQFLVPSAQVVVPGAARPIAGEVSISDPCTFNEDQYMANVDWNQSDKSRWQERFFFVNSHELSTINNTFVGSAPSIPGFATSNPNHFRNFSLANEHVFTPQLLNQFVIGYNRILSGNVQATPFTWGQIGVTAPEGPYVYDNTLPTLSITGNFGAGGEGETVTFVQNQYSLQDNLSWVKGRHTLRIGGGAERDDILMERFHITGGLVFPTFADFLLGESGAQNGTGISNVTNSRDAPGDKDRSLRIYNAGLYLQDDFKVTERLMVNAGLRFERLGDAAEEDGHSNNFDFSLANPNPPASGTLQGFVVAGNFPGGAAALPAGVAIVSGSKIAYAGSGQNSFDPRLGFSWMIPGSNRFVLRGGYGMFHQAVSGGPTTGLVSLPPWAVVRQSINSPALTFANPFPAGLPTFPSFASGIYSPTTSLSGYSLAADLRPPTIQHYSLSLQSQLARDMVFEVGYLGSRGTHLLITTTPNQALLASSSNPVRGLTTNTIANIRQRLPVEGFGPSSFTEVESTGQSWYNALEASLSKRYSHGLQFLASFTWARDLVTAINGVSGGAYGGALVGNQLDVSHDYGPDSFIRPLRFVLSGTYRIPAPGGQSLWMKSALGGWQLAGVLTLQNGQRLSVTNTPSTNVLGITSDFAELSPNCTLGMIEQSGAVASKLTDYINKSCFGNVNAPLPIVGADGKATGFGNTGPGILYGPGQANLDMSLGKMFPVRWPNDTANVEFRAEAFNAFNTPQFANPVTAVNSATFGQILNTATAPRIIQLALKLNF